MKVRSLKRDVHELARAASAWAEWIEPDTERRSLLLKLSAGLALAATVPSDAWSGKRESPAPAISGSQPELSGIWHSKYTFYSSSRNQPFEAEHYVVLRRQGSELSGESLPHSTDSKLKLDLSVQGSVVTGAWTERTSPAGYYRGATYHGALQLLIDPTGKSMTGKWLGFNKESRIDAGDWKLTWVDGSTSKQAQRTYHLKA